MRWLGSVTNMTATFARVCSAIENPATCAGANECAGPALGDRLSGVVEVRSIARHVSSPVGAQQLLFVLSAITTRGYANIASATETFMAATCALMLTTGHEFAANLAT